MESEKKMTKIVLSRSILNPLLPDSDWKVIPAGTELIFDEDGIAIFKGVQIFLYRIHKECIENPSQDLLYDYFPDVYIHEDDEILACDEDFTDRLITSNLGEVALRKTAKGVCESKELASEFDSNIDFESILNEVNSVMVFAPNDLFSAIVSDFAGKNHFVISLFGEMAFRLLTYSLALNQYEICQEDTLRGPMVYYKEGKDLFVMPFKFGRGKEWINEQIDMCPKRGRNGKPTQITTPSDNETLCVYGEIEGGQLVISPIGKQYGIELFFTDLFKDKEVFYRSESDIDADCRYGLAPLIYISD